MDKKLIIDVREPIEYKLSHVKGAINLPLSKLANESPDLVNINKDTPIILYCRSGTRAGMALSKLRSWGFTNLTNGINKHQVEANYL